MKPASIHGYLSRMARYRLWIGGLVIALLIGMQMLEALHRHHDGVTEENCPICLVAIHHVSDAPAPVPVTQPANWFLLYFTPPSTFWRSIADALPPHAYHSRAPPVTPLAI
ncbi:MAG TPA: hypothetical protein VL550_08990 [Rhodocyclaceae bacterium]|jgi:hypothetical protein|nr:hypothetical protein [Rhodocyclaceae bacterium]